MKRLTALILALLLCAVGALAQEAAEPLSLAEIEQFAAALLARAKSDALTPEQAEGGFAARGEGYEVLLSSPDVSPDAQVLGAALVSPDGDWAGAPRGITPGMTAADVLALFPQDNPELAGTRNAATLYIRGALPDAAHTGQLLRDAQEPLVAEYAVYYAQTEGGIVRAGMQFTFTGGFVSAARAFTQDAPLSMQEAQAQLDALAQQREVAEYVGAPQGAALPLSREDMALAGVDFFEADIAGITAILGSPEATETAQDTDGAELLTLQWPGVEAVFTRKGGAETLARLSVTANLLEGPRGLRVGDTLAQAIGRFAHGETLPEGFGALYGDATGVTPPYGVLLTQGADAQAYYAIATDAGTAALALSFLGDILVSMTITYL